MAYAHVLSDSEEMCPVQQNWNGTMLIHIDSTPTQRYGEH